MFKLRQKVTKIFLQLNHMFAIFRWRRSISILNIGYQYFVCLRINAAISFLPHLQVEEINVDGLTWEDVCLKIPVVKKPKCMDEVRKSNLSWKIMLLLFNSRVKRSQIIYRYSGVEGWVPPALLHSEYVLHSRWCHPFTTSLLSGTTLPTWTWLSSPPSCLKMSPPSWWGPPAWGPCPPRAWPLSFDVGATLAK